MGRKRHFIEPALCDHAFTERILTLDVLKEDVIKVIGNPDKIFETMEPGDFERRAKHAVSRLASKHGKKCLFCRRTVWYPAMATIVRSIIRRYYDNLHAAESSG